MEEKDAVELLTKTLKVSGEVRCQVCGAGIERTVVFCPRCETPHHEDCWNYNQGCSIFGCKTSTPLKIDRGQATPAEEVPAARERIVGESRAGTGAPLKRLRLSTAHSGLAIVVLFLVVAPLAICLWEIVGELLPGPSRPVAPIAGKTKPPAWVPPLDPPRLEPVRVLPPIAALPIQEDGWPQMLDTNPLVVLKTSRGEITIELVEDQAPNTVANFIQLAGSGFYDGTLFHRVIRGFMMQGGDPSTKKDDRAIWGTGGPGHVIDDECDNDSPLKHGRGVLSMANAGPNTNGSQFFITFQAQAHLDGRHTVFGRVIRGMRVVDKIEEVEAEAGPRELVKLETVRVIRKRAHPYVAVKRPERQQVGR
ncbi:MAG: peptidylprolyl isomerase [Candidatus Riflebacteria bacterium]|nr:peptidylprolyl isomerase [Candidatus Riflebacteria bacterium]